MKKRVVKGISFLMVLIFLFSISSNSADCAVQPKKEEVEIENSSGGKISIQLKKKINEIKESSDKDKKIPVYIWYQDVDQEKVDKQVEKMTGLVKEKLVQNSELALEETVQSAFGENSFQI